MFGNCDDGQAKIPASSDCEALTGITLLRLATSREHKGRTGRRDTVIVSVSHNELARLAGMSRPHVTIAMGRLRRRRLVHYNREGLVHIEVASLTDYLGRIVRGDRV